MTRTVMGPRERRRELLACAMRLFAEEGYDNVSVRAVARAAGVAPGLAYHYFDSKERMFAEAIGDYARRCAEGINAILDDVNVNPSFTDSTNAIAPIAPTHPRRFRRRQAPFPASRSGARSFVR